VVSGLSENVLEETEETRSSRARKGGVGGARLSYETHDGQTSCSRRRCVFVVLQMEAPAGDTAPNVLATSWLPTLVVLAAATCCLLYWQRGREATASGSAQPRRLTDEENRLRRLAHIDKLQTELKAATLRREEEAQMAAAARANAADAQRRSVAPSPPRETDSEQRPRVATCAPVVARALPSEPATQHLPASSEADVSVRVQFVSGKRQPVVLCLAITSTVGELKRRLCEAVPELAPSRVRLVFAGHVLVDEQSLAIVRGCGDGACFICQELAAVS